MSNWRTYYWKVYLTAQELKERGCANCGAREKLEFAHIMPTKLAGRGRGSHHRRLDVLKHRECYTVLCHRCHHQLDHTKKPVKVLPLSEPMQMELSQ